MKKILCLILAIATMCLTLVSCDDDILAQADEAINDFDLEIAQKESQVTVDFYIIGDTFDEANPDKYPDGSHESAHYTVANQLNTMFKENYNTGVDMHYINHDEYEETVKQALETYKAGKSEDRIFIVLVNDERLYEEIKSMDVLANLGTFINSSAYNYDYGKLKEELSTVLPLVAENVAGSNDKAYFALPNNNAYGNYAYFTINKDMVKEYALVTSAESCKDAVDIKAVVADFIAACKAVNTEISDNELIAKVDAFVGKTGSVTAEDLKALACSLRGNEFAENIKDAIKSTYEKKPTANATDIDRATSPVVEAFVQSVKTEVPAFEQDTNKADYLNDVLSSIVDFINSKYDAEINDFNMTASELKETVDTFANLIRQEVIFIPVLGYYGDILDAQADNYIVELGAPTVSVKDAYSSAFAVAGDTALAERAMRILYALNTDPYYRNLLQYGVEDINYDKTVKDGITTVEPKYLEASAATNTNAYKMSLKYTGSINNAYNCADEEVCLLCTYDKPCADGNHIAWTADNKVTCKTRIEYNLNGGNWADETFKPTTGITNTTVYLENYVPVKDAEVIVGEDGCRYEINCIFSGWYIDPSLTDYYRVKEVSPLSGANNGYKPVSLYAKWVKAEATTKVNYNLNEGESWNQNFAPFVSVINNIVSLADHTPVKADALIEEDEIQYTVTYTFAGWYTNPEYAGEAVVEIIPGLGEVNLYAKWDEVKTPVNAPVEPAE